MNDKNKIIRDLIKKESLRVIKESQASFLSEASSVVDDTMEDVNNVIGVYEKKLEKLNNEEKSAMDKEDYLELRNIKQSQQNALDKMIRVYEQKLKLLRGQSEKLEQDMKNIDENGASVFKNQEMKEFESDNFEKGNGIRIEVPNYFMDLAKIADHNSYKVMNTNIPGLEVGTDLAMMPNLKIGGSGKVSIYRKVGDRYENVKDFQLKNIKKLIKNPK